MPSTQYTCGAGRFEQDCTDASSEVAHVWFRWTAGQHRCMTIGAPHSQAEGIVFQPQPPRLPGHTDTSTPLRAGCSSSAPAEQPWGVSAQQDRRSTSTSNSNKRSRPLAHASLAAWIARLALQPAFHSPPGKRSSQAGALPPIPACRRRNCKGRAWRQARGAAAISCRG